tara:strand:- start:175 stop:477 length:303 start_codon:yes stop_codon:yes gene_type:complete
MQPGRDACSPDMPAKNRSLTILAWRSASAVMSTSSKPLSSSSSAAMPRSLNLLHPVSLAVGAGGVVDRSRFWLICGAGLGFLRHLLRPAPQASRLALAGT